MEGWTRRELGGGLAASLLAAALANRPALAQAAAAADPYWFVHPQLRPIVVKMQGPAKASPPSAATLPQIRQRNAAYASKPLPDVAWEERSVPAAAGAPPVRIYLINAKPGASRPGILHTHGGGYIAGGAEQSIRAMQKIAMALDCAVVTVDYRLAPETRWSGSREDNYAGLKWLHAQAEALGVDRDRLAVMGESAGGGHAALLAIAARDRGEVPLKFQCLTYPMLDDRTGSSRPVPLPVGAIGWTAPDNRFGWSSFLGMAPGGPRVPVAAVPARTASLKGLPPAWIGVGSIDLFVDEDIAYARRLIDAGVSTELIVVPGAPHGFDGIPEFAGVDVPISRQFNEARLAALRRALVEA